MWKKKHIFSFWSCRRHFSIYMFLTPNSHGCVCVCVLSRRGTCFRLHLCHFEWKNNVRVTKGCNQIKNGFSGCFHDDECSLWKETKCQITKWINFFYILSGIEFSFRSRSIFFFFFFCIAGKWKFRINLKVSQIFHVQLNISWFDRIDSFVEMYLCYSCRSILNKWNDPKFVCSTNG